MTTTDVISQELHPASTSSSVLEMSGLVPTADHPAQSGGS